MADDISPSGEPRRREPVTPADGIWLQDSPENPMIINGVFTIERLELETLRRLWQERIIEAHGERFPRFTQRVVQMGRRSFWEEHRGFDVRHHIVPAPAAANEQALRRHIGAVASEPLPSDRPLWQLQVVEEYGEGSSAVIFRLHHAMGDGVALLPVIFTLMDDAPDIFAPHRHPGRKVSKARPSKLVTFLKAPLLGPLVALGKLARRADLSPMHGPAISGAKQVAWSEPIPVELVKALKSELGASFNDVLMACVAGAFRRYLEAASGQPLAQLRASVPVNLRAADEPHSMGNKFATLLLELPAHIADARRRVRAVKERMDTLKRSIEPLVMYGAQAAVLKALPRRASRGLIDFLANKCTCVLTNVPGPEEPLYIGGRRVHDLMFWVPQRARIGIGVSILTFSGTLRLGVIADEAVMGDPNAMVVAFHEEIESLEAHLSTA